MDNNDQNTDTTGVTPTTMDAQAIAPVTSVVPSPTGASVTHVPPPPAAPVYAVGEVVNNHMWNGTTWVPMQSAPPPPASTQPIVINNTVSSSATAAATALATSVTVRPHRKQSFWAHFWLFCFTCGIGNFFYWRSVRNWNRGR